MNFQAAQGLLRNLPAGTYSPAQLRQLIPNPNLNNDRLWLLIRTSFPGVRLRTPFTDRSQLIIHSDRTAEVITTTDVYRPGEREVGNLRGLPPGSYTIREILTFISRGGRVVYDDLIQTLLMAFPGIQLSGLQPEDRLVIHEDGTAEIQEEEEIGREISFRQASQMIHQGRVTSFLVDPQNQLDLPPGTTRVTLIGIDGREYDVVANYNPVTAQILPPS